MKITIYKDDSINIDLDCISQNISRLAPSLGVVKGRSKFKINEAHISYPSSYNKLSSDILKECKNSDYVPLFTEIPYDNNYFWGGLKNKAIISLSGWEHLTDIPKNNGAVFFICALILQFLNIGVRHDKNTGCINDYWMDKTGVDLGMRTGSICSDCLEHFRKRSNREHSTILSHIQIVLNAIGIASRTGLDICEYWSTKNTNEDFDVFLCHNSQDKDAVRDINIRLKTENIKTWFDEEQLPPGRLWQELLEEQIGQIKTVAVIVGQSGLGPWQDIELRAFLSEFVKRRCPVIPVIFSECTNIPKLPLFLSQFTWVDFRKNQPDPFSQLLWGITGQRN